MRDLQAMDRAHRLGQQRTVNVYRLLVRGTLEEQIMSLQVRARAIWRGAGTASEPLKGEGGGGMLSIMHQAPAWTSAPHRRPPRALRSASSWMWRRRW